MVTLRGSLAETSGQRAQPDSPGRSWPPPLPSAPCRYRGDPRTPPEHRYPAL